MLNDARTPSKRLLSSSRSPPMSQSRVLSNRTTDLPTKLPWKSLRARDRPCGKTGGDSLGRFDTGTVELRAERCDGTAWPSYPRCSGEAPHSRESRMLDHDGLPVSRDVRSRAGNVALPRPRNSQWVTRCPRQPRCERICWPLASIRQGFSRVPRTSRTSSPESTRSCDRPRTSPGRSVREAAWLLAGVARLRQTRKTLRLNGMRTICPPECCGP